ncbi:glycosyltransferase WbuB [Pseudacidovorax intermedius]|uniref:glycosyltransferase WbuB n=1 Tax=Pseudacidovorax intermedius TaxID=433924 RepID=UPI0026EB0579|nr:glycosyltransferase WbuB [Pseudacidovorax intermedius]
MRILIYGINYSPELTGIGKYTGEMARWLNNNGHEIRVVCAPPYYPMWRVDNTIGNRYSESSEDGVKVYRAPLWVPAQPRAVTRILHLLSFAVTSVLPLIRQLRWKPDLIWCVEPTLACAPATLLLAKISGSKTWLHVQDFEVDAAFGITLKAPSTIKRIAFLAERQILRKFDVVSTISSKMVELANKKRNIGGGTILFRNWVDCSFINRQASSDYRRELNLLHTDTVVLYSGNMGGKQGLEILPQVAERLKNHSTIKFVFCGNGAMRDELAEQCEGLENVQMMDLQPFEKLNELLNLADIHLLPQRSDAADLVLPSKLTGMLASGRPVIATAHKETELGQIFMDAQCGVIVEPESSEALASAILKLAEDEKYRELLGKNARQYAIKKLDKESILQFFNEHIISVSQS